MHNLEIYIMLTGMASKGFTKGYPQTRKIANFDNIKGNVNEMKTYKTKFLCKIKTEWNELINSKYKHFVIIALFTYRPALAEKTTLRNKISFGVVHLPRDFSTNDKIFFYSKFLTITYTQVI
jgi:hypothetical protein